MKQAGIYLIRNANTGRVYVGSSRDCGRRFSEHKSRLIRGVHCNAKLQASWNKHGSASFCFEVIASVLDVSFIEQLEQQFLDELDCVKSGYNLAPTAGNTAGWRASDETRVRMSRAAKARDNSAQVVAMAAATRGKRRPKYVIDAMQAGRLSKPLSDAARMQMSRSAIARSRYGQDDRRRMSEMRDGGKTWREIGAAFGVGHGPVMLYVQQWRAANAR